MKLSRFKIKIFLIFLDQNALVYYTFAGIIRVLLYAVMGYVEIANDYYIVPLLCMLLTEIILVLPILFVNEYMPWIVGKKKREI